MSNCPRILSMTNPIVHGQHLWASLFLGFSQLYHPDFTPSYTCRLSAGEVTRTSPSTSVLTLTHPDTGRVFYAIDWSVKWPPIPPYHIFTMPASLASQTGEVHLTLYSNPTPIRVPLYIRVGIL